MSSLATRHSFTPSGVEGSLATSEFAREFSSTEYSKTIAGIVSGEPPAIDLAAEKRLIDCLVALASEGVLESAHDVSDGGLAVALAESCFASSNLGANVKIGDVPAEGVQPAEFALFGERGARCMVSVAPEKLDAVFETAREYGVGATRIGGVSALGGFRIIYNGTPVVYGNFDKLRDAWANSLERAVTAK